MGDERHSQAALTKPDIGPPSALELTGEGPEGADVIISHLDAAAYLMHAGDLAIRRCDRITRTKFRFVFYDPDHKAEELLVAWVNSPERRFADCVQAIKSALHGFHRSGGRR